MRYWFWRSYFVLLSMLAIFLLASCASDVTDEWLTPREFESRTWGGTVDCEDYAIYRFWTLRSYNVDVWLVYGTKGGVAHMWVEDKAGRVLDTGAPQKLIPTYYFNENCLRMHSKDAPCIASKRSRKWSELMGRM